MRLVWVNHASFLVESGNIRLLCDPWIEGTIFNNGWRLMSPTQLRYEAFEGVTHIWFSHEHPDHFFPPNLRNIPADIRRTITVLFHETRDKRVVNTCKSLGFAVRELPNYMPVLIGPDFRIVCGLNDLIDSWMAIFAEGKAVLNLNDCVFPKREELLAIRRMTGQIDLMLSQFSYANWVGNPGDLDAHRAHATRKREQLKAQIELFRPRQFIPFASYVYFCHEENFHMNQSVNRIGDIRRFLADELQQESLVLYPADEWEVGAPHDSADAIERYDSDFKIDLDVPPLTSRSVDLETLQTAMSELVDKCKKRNNSLVLNAMPSSVIRLADLRQDAEISYRRGMQPVHGKQADIVLSSDSMLHCIKTDWGGETLKINGRFEVPSGANAVRFFKLFRVPQYNGYGENVDLRFVAARLLGTVRNYASN
ncbi:MAG TPA: MBL fold metallo-hydrolase [Verrucomicrobiae bacterium]|nr:MBL fold metallo-hydrolase [Verrucomicrobiae bacterium]